MDLSFEQADALKELFNIGVGKAADSLYQLVGRVAKLEIPEVDIVSSKEMLKKLKVGDNDVMASVEQGFQGPFSGTAALALQDDDAQKLVSVLTGEDVGSEALKVNQEGTLNEIANILINSLLGTVANLLGGMVEYELPKYTKNEAIKIVQAHIEAGSDITIVCKTRFIVEDLKVEGFFLMFVNLKAINQLIGTLDQQIHGSDS